MASFSSRADLAGLYPIYYNPSALDRGFVGAPRDLVDDPQIDKVTLAASIVWPGANPLNDGYTYFDGVRRLRAGEEATIDENKLTVVSHYPRENYGVSFSETARQTGLALRQGIADIVAGEPEVNSSDFSGGLDSTTLALAAAKQCSPETNILGLVQHNKEYPAGDVFYARKFAKLSSALLLQEIVTSSDGLPFVQIPPLDVSPDEPYRGTAIFAREQQRLLAARRRHITGDGGDALFDPEPMSVIADLQLRGEDKLASRIALQVGRAAHRNPTSILELARIKTRSGLSQSFERVAQELLDGGLPQRLSTDWLPALGEASTWMPLKMREALAERTKELASRTPDMSYSELATREAILDSGDAHRHLRMLGERYGVNIFAPYLGEAVLSRVIQLPASMRVQPDTFKSLLAMASKMADLAPSEIFTRKGKGSYSGEMYAGFDKMLPGIKARLDNSRLAHLGIIDSEAVARSLSQKQPPISSVVRLLASETWLEHLGIEAPEVRHAIAGYSAEADRQQKEIVSLDENYAVKPTLSIVSLPGGQYAAFDRERGVFMPPIGRSATTRLIIETLAATNSPRLTLELLQERYPTVPMGRLITDLAGQIHDLSSNGWLQPTGMPSVLSRRLPAQVAQQPPMEAGETMRIRKSVLPSESVSKETRVRVEQAFAKMQELTAEDMAFTELTDYILEGNSQATKPSSYEEALHALELARTVTAGDLEHRIGCYELSLTAACFCIANKLSVDWCLGVSSGNGKPDYHAYLEANGEPVRGEADEIIKGVYQRVLRVGKEVI